MKKTVFLIILLFAFIIPIFLLSGCSVFSSLGLKHPFPSNGGYRASLRRATRKADIYNNLNTVMYIRATYLDKSFMRSYEDKYYDYYMKHPKNLIKKIGKSTVFLVSVYTPRKSYNNLDSKRSIWMVYLTNNEGESLMPLSIKPSQQKKVFLKKFFPYVTDWSRQYIIKFPKYYDNKEHKLFLNSGVKWIKLLITGVNGKAVLKWNLNSGTN
jgi:hypothetical protein